MNALLAMLFLFIGCAPGLSAEPPEREISFQGAQGIPLKGSWMSAAKSPRRCCPSLLLVAGSGPSDRNGDQPAVKTGILKQIAVALAESGTCSLRFDKRASFPSRALWPKETKRIPDFFSWENHIADVKAAFSAMEEQPELCDGKAGILGHSEGALLALAVTSRAKVSALVLVAGTGRNLKEVLRDQLARALASANSEERAKVLQRSQEVMNQIETTGVVPDDLPVPMKPAFNGSVGKFFQGAFSFDPLEPAKKFSGPVLVVQGDRDHQISVERDTAPLIDSLQARSSKNEALLIVHGASHYLKAVGSEQEKGLKGPVVPSALRGIARWVKDKAFPSPSGQGPRKQ